MKTLKEAVEEYQGILDLHSIHCDIGVFWTEAENWKYNVYLSTKDSKFKTTCEKILRGIAKTDPNAVVLYNTDYEKICENCLDDTLTRYIYADISYYYNENNKEKSHNIYTFLEEQYSEKNTTTETEKEHDNMENAKQQQSMTRNDVIRIMEKELQELSEYNAVVDVPEDKCRTSEVMLEIARFLAEVKDTWE